LPYHEYGTGCRCRPADLKLLRSTHFGMNGKNSYLSLFTGTKEQTDLLCDAPSVY